MNLKPSVSTALKDVTIYYTVGDFGDPPIILRCKYCNEYYWYTPEENAYLRPLSQQIENLKCEKCGAELKTCLVPAHKNIECCGYRFSLDDDFADNKVLKHREMVPVDVYLIYSE